MKKRALLYARISTTEQSNYSLEYQRQRMFEFCERQGIEPIKYFEESYSAKNFEDRPVFTQLINYAKQNRNSIDYLIVLKWDRLSRNLSLALAQINDFKRLGIEINSVDHWIDFSVPENLLLLAISLASPEVENTRRSMNTIAGMRSAQKQGRWVHRAPTGYKNTRDSRNLPVVVPDDTLTISGYTKAELLRQLWQEFASGHVGVEELRLKYRKLGLVVQKSCLGRVLRNPFYMGHIKVDDYREDKGGLFKGIHEPLVDEHIFWTVQDILSGRKPRKHRTKAKMHDQLPLRGLIRCGDCGRIMTGSGSRGRNGSRHFYYHCESRTGCSQRIRADQLEKDVITNLHKTKPNRLVLDLYLEILTDSYINGRELKAKQDRAAKEQINELKAKLETLEEKYLFGDLDASTYQKWKSKLNQEISNLKPRRGDGLTLNKRTLDNVSASMDLLTNLDTYFETGTPTFKKDMLGSIISDKLVVSNKQLDRTNFHPIITELSELRKKSQASLHYSAMVPPQGLEPRSQV